MLVRLAAGTDLAGLGRALPPGATVTRWLPAIDAAELWLPGTTTARPSPAIIAVRSNGLLRPLAAGPDPRLAEQWGLAQIGAPAAWGRTTGQGVVIAIVDTGAELAHPDLSAQLWVNPAEIAANGVDDDDNGYIDDMHGWHWFHDLDGVARSDGDLNDQYGHGTHVAGIAGAARNNAVGGAGVAPDARLMILRVFQSPSYPADLDGLESDVAAAVIYAADHGAAVINLSLGGSVDDPVLQAAMQYALVAARWSWPPPATPATRRCCSQPATPRRWRWPRPIRPTPTPTFRPSARRWRSAPPASLF